MKVDTIRPVLRDQIAALIGLETVWEEGPRPFNPQNLCLLKLSAMTNLGQDENRPDFDDSRPQGQEINDVWVVNRLFTLTVKVESLDQTDEQSAYHYLEGLREKLRFRGFNEILLSVNTSLVDVLPTVDLSVPFDDRMRSIAAFDLRLFTRSSVQDTAGYTYIETFTGQWTET